MEGRVFKSTGSWYEVIDSNRTHYQCRLRGKIKLKGLKVSNPIAVGDIVSFEKEEKDPTQGVIYSILPRENYIVRKATQQSKQSQILASNLDLAVLMATFKHPRTSLGFIDRFLVAAESFRIPVTIVFNKSDLLERDELEIIHQVMEQYNAIGYPCMLMSVLKENSLDEFNNLTQGKTTLLAGHSGVGKSSLMNKLIPGLTQKTAQVSSFANKGVHTTTFAEMFAINDDTFLIDTPGVKELGLYGIGKEELSHYFPEMREHLGKCKFHNCSHTHEPGCYIHEMVENGTIFFSRFESYLSMLQGGDNRN